MYILKYLKTVFSGELLILQTLSYCIRVFTENPQISKHGTLTESNSKYLIHHDVKLSISAEDQEHHALK